MTSTFRLGRILGVRVGVNWSVLVVAWLLTWIYISWANAHYDASVDGLRK